MTRWDNESYTREDKGRVLKKIVNVAIWWYIEEFNEDFERPTDNLQTSIYWKIMFLVLQF